MTEQIRAVAWHRLTTPIGNVDADCLHQMQVWLSDFLDLSAP